MRADDVLDIYPPEKILVRLGVIVSVGFPYDSIVVYFGKKTRCPEHDARKSVVPVEQLAEVLRGRFGHTVDVLWNGRNILR